MERQAVMAARLLPLSPALERTWWSLWHADPHATPFQSPAWLVPWAGQFAADEAMLLVVGEQPVTAIVPVYRYGNRWLLWGAGTSDWLGGVFSPDAADAELHAALQLLPGPLELFQLPATSPLLRLSGTGVHSSASCVGLPLPAELPRNMAHNLAYYRRKAERAGLSAPRRAGPEAFEALVDLHGRRWHEKHELGVLADPRVLAWHRAALPRLEAAGLLRLYVLEQGESAVGALYVLSGKHAAYYYIGGFDPEFAACGVGTILIGHAIAEAEREGRTWFDFLRGEEPYKYRWGATDIPTYAALFGADALSSVR